MITSVERYLDTRISLSCEINLRNASRNPLKTLPNFFSNLRNWSTPFISLCALIISLLHFHFQKKILPIWRTWKCLLLRTCWTTILISYQGLHLSCYRLWTPLFYSAFHEINHISMAQYQVHFMGIFGGYLSIVSEAGKNSLTGRCTWNGFLWTSEREEKVEWL